MFFRGLLKGADKKVFIKKRKHKEPVIQTAVSDGYDRGLYSYFTAGGCERRLYKQLRDNVPIIDAAIYKIVRLIGGFRIECNDKKLQQQLNNFLDTVPVGASGIGIDSFLSVFTEQLLLYGTAVGEIVPDITGTRIAGLYNSNLDNVELCKGDDPFGVNIYAASGGIRIPVKYPSLILYSALMPEPDSVYGTSLLRGLPFVSDVLMKIFRATGTNWDRIGNVRFSVSYKPGENERAFSKERAKIIASEWSKAMKSREPRDFVTVGDVSIKVIGADNQIPDSEIPVRQLLEQIVAKLSIPPFLLGLSWSTTERMSSQQADILTSELEYYRRCLGGIINRLCTVYLKLGGYRDSVKIVWDNINLQDEVELARARLYNAQAEKTERGN